MAVLKRELLKVLTVRLHTLNVPAIDANQNCFCKKLLNESKPADMTNLLFHFL